MVTSGAASTAARTMSAPPGGVDGEEARPQRGDRPGRAATVLGMSCSLRSRNTSRPAAAHLLDDLRAGARRTAPGHLEHLRRAARRPRAQRGRGRDVGGVERDRERGASLDGLTAGRLARLVDRQVGSPTRVGLLAATYAAGGRWASPTASSNRSKPRSASASRSSSSTRTGARRVAEHRRCRRSPRARRRARTPARRGRCGCRPCRGSARRAAPGAPATRSAPPPAGSPGPTARR